MKSNFQLNKKQRKRQIISETMREVIGWTIIAIIGIGGAYYVYHLANI